MTKITLTKELGMSSETNPCAAILTDPLVSMGVGGTRLHITGTREELEMVREALDLMCRSTLKRSALMKQE